jgi:hypothetical protein
MMLDCSFDDLELGELGYDPSFTVKSGTSDKLRTKAKKFLHEIDVRETPVKNQTLLMLENIEELRLPAKNEQMRIRTQQQINLISVVLKMASEHKVIDCLSIATYTFNREALEVISDLVKSGSIKSFRLFLASSYEFRDSKYLSEVKNRLSMLSESFDVSMVMAWLHFKITLAKCGDDFYQMEGSMNYSTNNMAEQLLLENNKSSYDYDLAFFGRQLHTGNAAVKVIC